MTASNSPIALTPAQAALVPAGGVVAHLAIHEATDIDAQAASGSTFLLVAQLLLGAAAPAGPSDTAEPVVDDRDPSTSVDDEDELLDDLPTAGQAASELLRAWQQTTVNADLARYRTAVLWAGAYDVYRFDSRLADADGGEPFEGVIVSSDRRLLTRFSRDSAGAAAEADGPGEGPHTLALVLEPGDGVVFVDPTTGEATALFRDATTGALAAVEASWTHQQAVGALKGAPIDSDWRTKTLEDEQLPADASPIAWLGRMLREAPRDPDLDPLAARTAWATWRHTHITRAPLLLAEHQAQGLIHALQDQLRRSVPTQHDLLDDGPWDIDAAIAALAEAHALRARLEDVLMVGGPLADRSHAVPRIDRLLDRARVALDERSGAR